MPVISGGQIIAPATAANPGTKTPIYRVAAVPTDANIGVAVPANGMIAENTTNGNIYERQAGVWVRIDTL